MKTRQPLLPSFFIKGRSAFIIHYNITYFMGRTSAPQSHDLSGVRPPLTMPVSTLPIVGLSFKGLISDGFRPSRAREKSLFCSESILWNVLPDPKSRIRKRHSVKEKRLATWKIRRTTELLYNVCYRKSENIIIKYTSFKKCTLLM